MRRTIGWAVLGVLVAAGVSCARKPPASERERVFLTDGSKFTWTGKSLEQVIQVFGPPSSRETDGAGGTVLTYEEIRAIGDTPQARTRPSSPDPAQDPGAPSAPSTALPQDRTVAMKQNAQFWVGPDGKVYRFWFSPEMYRKGVPSPPSS